MKTHFLKKASLLLLIFYIFSCSNEESVTSNKENTISTEVASRPNTPIMTDQIRIGNQIWSTKNLNTSRYRNGDLIPRVNDPAQWANLTTGAWHYYDNNPANGIIYGKQYNWYAVSDPRGLAPQGWHIPDNNEWDTLANALGGASVAGGMLKAANLWHCFGTTNNTGFNALPGGMQPSYVDVSYGIGETCYWWTTTQGITGFAWFREIACGNNSDALASFYYSKRNGFSVRCIKD